MYTVPTPSNKLIALEALQIDVRKRKEGKLNKEAVYNTLQKYRDEIGQSMSRIVELNNEMSDEYLDTAMSLQYQNRGFELSSSLLARSTEVIDYANRGMLNILPIVQPQALANKISSFRGPLPNYSDSKAALRTLKLYIQNLRRLVSHFNKDLFLEPDVVSKNIETVRSILDSFETPFCKFVTKDGNDHQEAYTFTEQRKQFPSKDVSLVEAGWTINRVVDFQVQLDDVVIQLGKVIFEIAQTINRFIVNPGEARSYSLFNIFAPPLVEALGRIPEYVIQEHETLWAPLRKHISTK